MGPSCRCACIPQNIRKMPFIERQIKKLKVKCPNHSKNPKLEQLMDSNENEMERSNSRSIISIPNRRNRVRLRDHSCSRSRSRSRSRERKDQESLCEWTGAWGDVNA